MVPEHGTGSCGARCHRAHFAPIQAALLARIRERFPLGARFLVYDTTNYYTFIHTFNSRPCLPQRGKNKQRRGDLRQISFALVVDEEQGLPLYYRCYEGNTPDVDRISTSSIRRILVLRGN